MTFKRLKAIYFSMVLQKYTMIIALTLASLIAIPLLANEAEKVVQNTQATNPEEKPNSTLRVGDRLYYSVIEDRKDRMIVFVDEKGNITIPLIGSIEATGKTTEDVSREITQILEKDYYNRATVIMTPYEEKSSRGKVFLLGQIEKQGPVEIPTDELLTVTKAILLGGGFTRFADTTSVTITRKDPANPNEEIKTKVNVRDILEKGQLEKDVILQGGDVIFIPEKGEVDAKVFVIGEVRSPGYYSIPPGRDFTVSQAILQAGGFTEFADKDDVKLVRGDTSIPEKERTIYIDAEKIFEKGDRTKDYKLENNDMIIVDEKWINF